MVVNIVMNDYPPYEPIVETVLYIYVNGTVIKKADRTKGEDVDTTEEDYYTEIIKRHKLRGNI